jgi:uncharacterized CHY-type Zn-finger protein
VNVKWNLSNHPHEDLFEDYSFDRLSEQETALFEEHLLMCQECQKLLASTEEYVEQMKGASLAYAATLRGSQRNPLSL